MTATEGVRKGGLKVRAPAEILKAPSGREGSKGNGHEKTPRGYI